MRMVDKEITDIRLWRHFRRTRSHRTYTKLVERNIGLLRTVAGQMMPHLPKHLDQAELESAGIHGLLAAIEVYDPDRDTQFATYAKIRIRGAILDDIRSRDPVPRKIREQGRRLDGVVHTLEQTLLRTPDQHEVAASARIDLAKYQAILLEMRSRLQLSLDAQPSPPTADAPAAPTASLRDTHTADPLQATVERERADLLGALIDELPERERTVLALYYREALPMKEIATTLDLSESRVSQLHATALGWLRRRLGDMRVSYDDLALETTDS